MVISDENPDGEWTPIQKAEFTYSLYLMGCSDLASAAYDDLTLPERGLLIDLILDEVLIAAMDKIYQAKEITILEEY